MPYANLSYEWLGPAIFVSAAGAFLLLYLHDRRQLPILRLAGAWLLSVIGFVVVMLVDVDLQPAYQLVIMGSLFSGHFLLVWGVASLMGKDAPWLPIGIATLLVLGAVFYANYHGSLFWLRVIAVNAFTAIVYLSCCQLVWRARSHRTDVVLASVFLIQVVMSVSRIARIGLSNLDLSTHASFKSSQFALSMQTENAIFAIMLGLALFARYSVALVMQLQRHAETDPLTGLFNRRAFEAKAQALRTASEPLPAGLIICDIDHFKRVNDSHGHAVGDRTLKAFARLLERETPDAAICARLGGEEFCILITGLDEEATRLQAIHLRAAVERLRIVLNTGHLRLTASFGYSALDAGDELWTAVSAVDAAVYQAKNDGRNLVRGIASPVAKTGQAKLA
ncbi:GGDEF domain-containing protein [Hoeflea sp.]|uniref:GGDEF domain-containing protein n=1 Tax=Hoeflea sp. TaxID=1940281 RepID=UPI003A8ED8AB